MENAMSNRIQVHQFEGGLKCRTNLQVYQQWRVSELFVIAIDGDENPVGEQRSLARFAGMNPNIEVFKDEPTRTICVRDLDKNVVFGSANIDKMHGSA